jgi:hypothetical protein
MVAFRSLAVLGALFLVSASSGCGTLGKAELRRGVESLSSIAGEGRLLAQGVAEDRSRSVFTRVQAASLGEETQHESEKLADATPQPGLEALTRRAVALASQIGDQLGNLQTRPGDERTGRASAAALARQQRRADALVRAVELTGRRLP